MIIKKAKYKKKRVLQTVCVTQEVHGCDECRREIKDFPNEPGRLEMTVFYNQFDKVDHLHFCSWTCVLKHVPKIKTDYFMSLPHVMFDQKGLKSGFELIQLLKSVTPKV